MTTVPDRRKTKRVNPLLQGRLVRSIVLVPCLCLGAIAMGVVYLTGRLAQEATRSDAVLPSLLPLMYSVLAFVVFAAVFLYVRARSIAFHVAGPVYRFSETFRRIRTGDVAFRIGLRKGDVLGDLKDEINATLEWLEAHPPAGVEDGEGAAPQRADAAASRGGGGAVAGASAAAEPSA